MKISKSKQELARIISENGGWRDGAEFAAQDQNAAVTFFVDTPWRCGAAWEASGFEAVDGFGVTAKALTNWHQTILSRAEYFRLYQAPDADGWIEWKGGSCPVGRGTLVDVRYANNIINCGVSALTNSAHEDHVFGTCGSMTAANWGAGLPMSGIIAYRLHKPEQSKQEFCESVVRSIPEPDEQVWTNPPSIEQLAADYRNKLDFANRKQDEADRANMECDAALCTLEEAIAAIGFGITPLAATEKEPELVITDWRQWRVGDVVSWSILDHVGEFEIISVHHDQSRNIGDFEVKDKPGGVYRVYGDECRFIRRP